MRLNLACTLCLVDGLLLLDLGIQAFVGKIHQQITLRRVCRFLRKFGHLNWLNGVGGGLAGLAALGTAFMLPQHFVIYGCCIGLQQIFQLFLITQTFHIGVLFSFLFSFLFHALVQVYSRRLLELTDHLERILVGQGAFFVDLAGIKGLAGQHISGNALQFIELGYGITHCIFQILTSGIEPLFFVGIAEVGQGKSGQ